MIEKGHFSGQQPGEEIVLFLRKHPLTLAWSLRFVMLAFLIGLPGLVVLWTPLSQYSGGLLLGGLVVAIILGLAAAWECALWYYDVFVVTNRRLLDLARKPFIYERRDEAQLSRIQDVKLVFPNPLALFLKFGNVQVQTAGTKGTINFRLVPEARKVQARILDLAQAAQQRGGPPTGEAPEVTAMRQYLGMPLPAAMEPASLGKAVLEPFSWRGYVRSLFRPALDLKPSDSVWRKHWWRLIEGTAVPGAIFNLGLVTGILMLWSLGLTPWLLLPLILIAVGGVWSLWSFLDWDNDLYILTDDRIIDIEKIPLISEDRREARLQQIQDVHYVMPSLLNRLLDFGNVEIETAGRGGGFTFDSVPHPREVQAEIFERLDRMRKTTGAGERLRQEGDVLGVLYRYREASAPSQGYGGPIPGGR